MSMLPARSPRTRTVNHRLAVCLVALAGVSLGLAHAQETNQNVLSGPKVEKTDAAPGVRSTFGKDRREGKDRLDRIPPRAYMRALDETIFNPEAPEDVRATDAQKTRIREIRNAYMDELRAFHDEHEDEIRGLRRQIGDKIKAHREALGHDGGPDDGPRERPHRRGGRGGPRGERPGHPGAEGGPEGMPPPPPHDHEGDPMMDMPPEGHGGPENAEAFDKVKADVQPLRDQLRALHEKAPKPDAAWSQVWAQLTEPQQKAVQAELDALAHERDHRRAHFAGKAGKGPGKGPGPGPGPGGPRGEGRGFRGGPEGQPPAGAENVSPERRRRLMTLFSELSPEEQDAVLDSMGKK